MKKQQRMVMGAAVVLAGVVALAGCAKQSDSEDAASEGVGERTGAAMDTAVEKTMEAGAAGAENVADAAKATGSAIREGTGKAMEKTGEALETTGDAVTTTGADMDAPPEPASTEE